MNPMTTILYLHYYQPYDNNLIPTLLSTLWQQSYTYIIINPMIETILYLHYYQIETILYLHYYQPYESNNLIPTLTIETILYLHYYQPYDNNLIPTLLSTLWQ